MAITTIYKCDLCGHEQDNANQMWNVGIMFTSSPHLPTVSNSHIRKMALWCRTCMVKHHLLGDEKGKEVAPPIAPTLEEMIREIMRDEIEAGLTRGVPCPSTS